MFIGKFDIDIFNEEFPESKTKSLVYIIPLVYLCTTDID